MIDNNLVAEVAQKLWLSCRPNDNYPMTSPYKALAEDIISIVRPIIARDVIEFHYGPAERLQCQVESALKEYLEVRVVK